MQRTRITFLSAGLLPLVALLLLGDLVWALKERAVQEVVKAQLRQFSEDPLLLNILFGALPAMLAVLFGPAVGAWSDRTRSRLGRRIPFLLVCVPLVSASLVGLACSEPLADLLVAEGLVAAAGRRQAVVLCMGTFWCLFELFTIVGNALFIALINDTVPHAFLGRFFGLFRIVSLGVGASFFYFVFGNDLPSVARDILLAIAIVYLAGFLVVCAFVHERPYPAPARDHSAAFGRLREPGGESPRYYLLLFASIGVATICLLPININSYNAISQFGVDRNSYGHAVAITYCISIGLALPLGWLADRVHPLRVGLLMLALYALSMLAAWFTVSGRLSFLIWFVVHGVLSGAFLTGTAALLPTVLPRHRFSELAAFSGSASAVLAMFFTPLVGAMLEWSGSDFRLIFLAGGIVAAAGCGLWFALLRAHCLRLGAPAAAARCAVPAGSC